MLGIRHPIGFVIGRKNYAAAVGTTKIVNDILLIDVMICLYIELLKCYFEWTQYLNFIPDVLNIYLIVVMLKNISRNGLRIRKAFSTFFAISFICLITIYLIVAVSEFVNGYWRYRYILFGFIAFYMTRRYMTAYYWDRMLKVLYRSLIINTVLVVYQSFVMKTLPDFTNGIFGFIEYSNHSHGVYCLTMSIIGVEYFIKGVIREGYCISMIMLSFISCALSEIKAYYVIFLACALLIIILDAKDTKVFRRIFKIVVIGAIGLLIAYAILMSILPENMYAFTSIENWMRYENWGDSIREDYRRTTQMKYVYKSIFNENAILSVFGIGIGYKSEIVGYELSKLYMNFGILGLGMFLLYLASELFSLMKRRKKIPEAVISITMLASTIMVMLVWNAPLNRTSMLVFIIYALGSTKCFNGKTERKICNVQN